MDEGAVQESGARFRAIFYSAAIGIAVVNVDGYPVESNPALERMLGYSAAELRQMRFDVFTHPLDAAADLALARQLFDGRRDAYQIEKRYVRKDGVTFWGRLTASLVRDAAGRPRYAIGMVEDIAERVRLTQRRESLLRIVRGLAAQSQPIPLMQQLLSEAVELTHGDAGIVARWDERRQLLRPVWTTLPLTDVAVELQLGQGVGGRAVQHQMPVIENDYPGTVDAVQTIVQIGVKAAVAVPLLYEGRSLGVVVVTSASSSTRFTQADADMLELLAGMASTVLVGQERSRLEGVLLAARTAQHALSNHLGVLAGYTELAAADPRVPDDLRVVLQEAVEGAHAAARVLSQLQRTTRLDEIDQGAPGGYILDLSASLDG